MMTTKVAVFNITAITLIAKRLVTSYSLSLQDYTLLMHIEWGDSTIGITYNRCIEIENNATKIYYSFNTENGDISNGSRNFPNQGKTSLQKVKAYVLFLSMAEHFFEGGANTMRLKLEMGVNVDIARANCGYRVEHWMVLAF